MGIMDHIPTVFKTEFGPDLSKFSQNTELNNLGTDAASLNIPGFNPNMSPLRLLVEKGVPPLEALQQVGDQAAFKIWADRAKKMELQFFSTDNRARIAADNIIQRYPELITDDLRIPKNKEVIQTFANHYDIPWQYVNREINRYKSGDFDSFRSQTDDERDLDERMDGENPGDPFNEMTPPGSEKGPDITIPFYKDKSGRVTYTDEQGDVQTGTTPRFRDREYEGDYGGVATIDPNTVTFNRAGYITDLVGTDPLTGKGYGGYSSPPADGDWDEIYGVGHNLPGWQESYTAIGDVYFGPLMKNPNFAAKYQEAFSPMLGMYALMELANPYKEPKDKRGFMRWFDDEIRKNPNLLKGIYGQDQGLTNFLLERVNHLSSYRGDKTLLELQIEYDDHKDKERTSEEKQADSSWDQDYYWGYLVLDEDWSRSIAHALFLRPGSGEHNRLNMSAEESKYRAYVNHKMLYSPEDQLSYLEFLKETTKGDFTDATSGAGSSGWSQEQKNWLAHARSETAQAAAAANKEVSNPIVDWAINRKSSMPLYPLDPNGYTDPTSRFYKKQVSDVYDDEYHKEYVPRDFPDRPDWLTGIGEPTKVDETVMRNWNPDTKQYEWSKTGVDEATSKEMERKVEEDKKQREYYLETYQGGATESDLYQNAMNAYEEAKQREREQVERLYTPATLAYYDKHLKLPDAPMRKTGIGDQSIEQWLRQKRYDLDPVAMGAITRKGQDKLSGITRQQALERLKSIGYA